MSNFPLFPWHKVRRLSSVCEQRWATTATNGDALCILGNSGKFGWLPFFDTQKCCQHVLQLILFHTTSMDSTGKKPAYKRWWFWVVAFFVFTTLLGLLNPSQTPQTDSTPQTTAEVPETNTEAMVPSEPPVITPPAAEPTPVIAVTEEPTSTSPSTLDQLWSAVDVSLKTREGIDVHYFPDEEGSVILYHQIETAWDENALVRKAYADLVYFGQEAFKIDGIPDVEVIIESQFTDQYGKSTYRQAVRIGMKKEEFQKYDWAALRYSPIWKQMKASASEYYIYPGMIADIETDKLYLE